MDIGKLRNDPSFLNWAYNREERDCDFWEQYILDHPESASQLLELRGELVNTYLALEEVNLNFQWNQVDRRIDRFDRHQKRRRTFAYAMAIAAILILGIFGLNRYFLSDQYPNQLTEKIETKPGEIKTFTLPDGSEVTLNGRSTLQYSPSFTDQPKRLVRLHGEAFFKVVKNQTRFVVQLPDAEITVLGTKFNVESRHPQSRVSLLEGSVDVRCGEQEVMLKPGQSAYIDERIDVFNEDVAAIASWKDGVWSFKNTPFAQLVNRLEDDFGLQVELKDQSLLSRNISGNLSTKDLHVLYQALESMLNIQIEEGTQGIVIQ